MAQVHCIFSFLTLIPRDERCLRGSHPCTMIDFTIGGSGSVVRDGQRTAFDGSSVLVHQASSVYAIEQRRPGLHVCVGVRGCFAERIQVGSYAADEQLSGIAQQLHMLIIARHSTSHLQIELLSGIAAVRLHEQHPSRMPRGIAEQARAIIDGEFHNPLSIAVLAARLKVGSDSLRKTFRSAFGKAPARYILNRRIAAAKELLRGSALSVQDIARLCGFSDPLHFSKQFHRMQGISPSSWRKQEGLAPQAAESGGFHER